MLKVKILPIAKHDIKVSAHWYNKKQLGLGMRFILETRKVLDFICDKPEANVIRYDNTRCALLDVFPYMVHYKVNIEQNQIIVIAIFHTSLNPVKWEKR